MALPRLTECCKVLLAIAVEQQFFTEDLINNIRVACVVRETIVRKWVSQERRNLSVRAYADELGVDDFEAIVIILE